MKPTANQIICGNNIDVVKSWPANCIDSIVTDPPYGLGFMGKKWDTLIEKTRDSAGGFLRDGKSGSNPYAAARCRHGSDSMQMQEWYYQWAKAMLRITKPGGFLLCFGGTRTYHRLVCAIEDAGWEIRDCMCWLYGSGFPKSHNISKAIDKKAGAKRQSLGESPNNRDRTKHNYNSVGNVGSNAQITTPATDLAQLWDGYGTALKPAWEPIIVAMKPLDGTFAHNAERHGVAGLNIEGGRIQSGQQPKPMKASGKGQCGQSYNWSNTERDGKEWQPGQGRWPANLVLDEETGAMLDEQSGTLKSGDLLPGHKRGDGCNIAYGGGGTIKKSYGGDSGGASRFFKRIEGPEPCFLCGYVEEHGNLEVGSGVFLCDECSLQGEALDLPKRFLYCAKTSRKERNMGMEDCEDKLLARSGGAQGAESRGKKEYLQEHIGLNRVAVVKNNHPTVKPLALMKYLCTLLKMPSAGQIILDPFMGSGTTGIACKELGINFIGIEKEQEYCEISVKRIAAVPGQEITLETTLPVTKNVETFRTTTDSAGGGRCPNENLPHVSESRQRIINVASAKLRENRK